MFVSPLTVIVKTTLVPSTVAATTFESEPVWPTMSISAPVAAAVSPTSRSISFELPVKLITALTVPQELLELPPVSYTHLTLPTTPYV